MHVGERLDWIPAFAGMTGKSTAIALGQRHKDCHPGERRDPSFVAACRTFTSYVSGGTVMWRAVISLALLLLSTAASAHKLSDSYLSLKNASETSLSARWDIAVQDLDFALDLDIDRDGKISWNEVKQEQQKIVDYALANLQIRTKQHTCVPSPARLLVDHHSDGSYVVLLFNLNCAEQVGTVEIDYHLLFALDAQHRGIVTVGENNTPVAILSPAQPQSSVQLMQSSGVGRIGDFFREGMVHIASGYDHIAFLLTLLIPSVLRRKGGTWHGVMNWRPAVLDTTKIVTAFTVAHSVTLGLAAFAVVRPPANAIEALIAASVIVATANNIVPLVEGRRWLVAFAFGLIHGFAFANALSDSGADQFSLVLALFLFNAGIETAQLLIVAAVFPFFYWLRHTQFYRRGVLVTGSYLILALGSFWLVQRVL